MKNLLLMNVLPAKFDTGLVILRLVGVVPLLLKHGLEKVFTFSAMSAHFPDPVHIGVVPSLAIAMVADAICTTLVIVGLATRWAALFTFINLAVAWVFFHHFEFFGHNADHGELVVLYMAIMLTIVFTGPGKYSIDAMIQKKV